ncbi:MAG: hypothetical protein ABWZ76_11985 [Acidimicrobiales bacterium]
MAEPQADHPTERSSSTLLDSMGARSLRRAEPRTSIAVAGAGCALAVLGVLLVSGDTGAGDDGDFNKWPGVFFSVAVVAAGYFTMSRVRRGALGTGGAVAAALGVPPLMFFLTVDLERFPPYSTEGILVVSTVAWLVTYVMGPGRGRPVFLGAGLLGLWFSLMQLTEDVFELPYLWFGVMASSFGASGEGIIESPPDAPDPSTLGLLSLVLGVVYLLACRALDDRGHHGTATPFALATLPTLLLGALFMADDLEQAGTGLLLVAIGLALAGHGATVWRRATTWVGGAATATGAAVFLIDMTDDPTVGGMLFLAAGIGLVFAGHVYATARQEPDEMEITIPSHAAVAPEPAPQPVPAATGAAPPVPARPGPPPPPPPPPVESEDTTQWAPPPDDPPPPSPV